MRSCHLHYHALRISKVGKLTSITNNALVHTISMCKQNIFKKTLQKEPTCWLHSETSHLFIWFTFIHFYFISIVPNLLRKMSRKPAVIKIFIKKKKIIALRTWLTSMLVHMHRYEYFNFYKKIHYYWWQMFLRSRAWELIITLNDRTRTAYTYSPGLNIWEFYNVLVLVRVAASKTKLDI